MDTFPIRRLSRLGNEALLSSTLAVVELGGGRYEWGVVALLLLSRCAADWVHDGVIERPVHIHRTLSIRAISQSLAAPYASIYRYVARMQERGLVIATDKGLAIGNDPAVAPAVVAFLNGVHDRFIRLVEDLSPDLDVGHPEGGPHPGLRAATVAAALDISLVPYEIAREPVTDWTSKLVWIIIIVANVRHITIDDELSRAFEIEPTPDALRAPINVGRIAAITGLSYGTTFRHCQKLAGLDVIRYERGGWVLVSRQLRHGDIDVGVRALLAYYAKRIAELVALGLPIDRIGDAYIGQRPSYAAMGVVGA